MRLIPSEFNRLGRKQFSAYHGGKCARDDLNVPNLYVGGRFAPAGRSFSISAAYLSRSGTRAHAYTGYSGEKRKKTASGTNLGFQLSSTKILFRPSHRVRFPTSNKNCLLPNVLCCLFFFSPTFLIESQHVETPSRSRSFPGEISIETRFGTPWGTESNISEFAERKSFLRSPFTGHSVYSLRFLPALARLQPRARKTRASPVLRTGFTHISRFLLSFVTSVRVRRFLVSVTAVHVHPGVRANTPMPRQYAFDTHRGQRDC